MLDEREGASDEVQQWALLEEDALGPRWHSRRRLPCAPRFQDGDVVELDSVQLFPSSHDRPEISEIPETSFLCSIPIIAWLVPENRYIG